MSKYNVPENNSLRDEIEELLELCEKAKEEYGENSSIFAQGIEEKEMTDWEKENGITIPESYKEWLRFSALCQIRQTLVSFNPPSEFHSEYVPEDFIVIGTMIGDGEVICFSKTSGEFIEFYEGHINRRYEDFCEVLNEVLRMLGKPQNNSNEDEEIETMLKKLAEIRRQRSQGK